MGLGGWWASPGAPSSQCVASRSPWGAQGERNREQHNKNGARARGRPQQTTTNNTNTATSDDGGRRTWSSSPRAGRTGSSRSWSSPPPRRRSARRGLRGDGHMTFSPAARWCDHDRAAATCADVTDAPPPRWTGAIKKQHTCHAPSMSSCVHVISFCSSDLTCRFCSRSACRPSAASTMSSGRHTRPTSV